MRIDNIDKEVDNLSKYQMLIVDSQGQLFQHRQLPGLSPRTETH